MIKNNWRIIKGLIEWFILVIIFSLLIFSNFSDYIVRSQMAEAFSLAFSLKSDVANFYEKHHRCPTNNELSDHFSEGRYVKIVQLGTLEGVSNCYIFARLREASPVDRRLRGKSIVLVMKTRSFWQTRMSCETDLTINLANCRIASLKE